MPTPDDRIDVSETAAKPKAVRSGRGWPFVVFALVLLSLFAHDFIASGARKLGLFASTDLEKLALCMENFSEAAQIIRMEQVSLVRAQCAEPYIQPIENPSVLVAQASFSNTAPSRQVAITIKNVSTDWIVTEFSMPFEFFSDAFVQSEPGGTERGPFVNKFENMWIEPGATINVTLNLDADYDFQKAMQGGPSQPFDWKIEGTRGMRYEAKVSSLF